MRVHERAGHPTPEVYEVPIEVSSSRPRGAAGLRWRRHPPAQAVSPRSASHSS